MTLETALNLLATLPGKPSWDDDIAALYSLHLADWHPDTRRLAVVDATLTCTLRPTLSELRELALKRLSPLPSPAALREALRRLILFYPPRERPAHATPLLSALADELGGWREIGMLDTDELERRFPSACQRVRHEYLSHHASQLLTTEPGTFLVAGKTSYIAQLGGQ